MDIIFIYLIVFFIMDDNEAKNFLKKFNTPENTPENISVNKNIVLDNSYTGDFLDDDEKIRHNNRIIKASDDILLDRLECNDTSLRFTDIVSAKDYAFKQNRIMEWKDDSDIPLIPSTINIQIINN